MKLKDIKTLRFNQVQPNKMRATNQDGKVPIDVFENQEEILIITPIAGVRPDQAEISITADTLTISGERQLELTPFDFKPKEAFLKECYWGKFSRSIILPPQANIDEIEATQKNHVLYIRIPKKKGVKMKIVKIQAK